MTAPRTTSDGTVDRPLPRSGGPPSRDDLVLAIIPLALLLAAVAGVVAPVELHDTMLVGGLVGAVALGDALFRNPPR